MFRRLLPQETSFFDFFEGHAALLVKGTRAFVDFVSNEENRDADHRDAGARRVLEIENEADELAQRCIQALHKTFITPIDRESIHQLIVTMDDIIDSIEAAADLITLYDVRELTPEIRELATLVANAAEVLERALPKLRRAQDYEAALADCRDIRSIESDADLVRRRALARLFREEKDAIELIKWKEIYEDIEDAADFCEDVANILESIILDAS